MCLTLQSDWHLNAVCTAYESESLGNMLLSRIVRFGSACRPLEFPLFLFACYLFWLFNQRFKVITFPPRHVPCSSKPLAPRDDLFNNFNNAIDRSEGHFIIPNMVHFILLECTTRDGQLDASIRSAFSSQPDSIVQLHVFDEACDPDLERLLRLAPSVSGSGRLQVLHHPRPRHIFGLPFRDKAHLQRVATLRILMKYGGIAGLQGSHLLLDKDLSAYRRYECVASRASPEDPGADGRVVMAHKDARQLRRWLHEFHREDAQVPDRKQLLEPELCRPM